MKFKNSKKFTSLLLGSMLIVAMAFTTAGCVTNKPDDSNQLSTEAQATEAYTTNAGTVNVLGEGKKMFLFTVVDKNGNETGFEIHTDKETVGEALLDLKLIDGDKDQYGLYVKSVNGITADYDVDKTYWAFYVNGEYALTGVDSTKIEEGIAYSFKVEK